MDGRCRLSLPRRGMPTMSHSRRPSGVISSTSAPMGSRTVRFPHPRVATRAAAFALERPIQSRCMHSYALSTWLAAQGPG